MTRDRLVLEDDARGNYRIMWYLAEERDLGATLGDEWPLRLVEANSEHGRATTAVSTSKGVDRDDQGFYWETKLAAATALKMAKAALKNRPLEDWEQKALAAGWKPPKGRM